ncbi:MAG: CAP domain-containing protein [Parcubacteria group bacterium]|jgi:uncharacterized protein YkwD
MTNTIAKLDIIRLGLFISTGVLLSLFYSNTAYAQEINSQNVINLINTSRTQNNLFPLNENSTLKKVAQSKANDMIANHYFSHTSPSGTTPWYWFDKNNYFYKYAGENLAINYEDAQEEQEAWMASPTHKKNILNSNFSEIGIATGSGMINGKKSNITVTVFGTPENKIFSNSLSSLSNKKNSYILGVQTKNNNPSSKEKTSSSDYQSLFKIAHEQSNKVIWTIALIAILIISKDIVLKSIGSKDFYHKHSLVNLILFIVIFSVLF